MVGLTDTKARRPALSAHMVTPIVSADKALGEGNRYFLRPLCPHGGSAIGSPLARSSSGRVRRRRGRIKGGSNAGGQIVSSSATRQRFIVTRQKLVTNPCPVLSQAQHFTPPDPLPAVAKVAKIFAAGRKYRNLGPVFAPCQSTVDTQPARRGWLWISRFKIPGRAMGQPGMVWVKLAGPLPHAVLGLLGDWPGGSFGVSVTLETFPQPHWPGGLQLPAAVPRQPMAAVGDDGTLFQSRQLSGLDARAARARDGCWRGSPVRPSIRTASVLPALASPPCPSRSHAPAIRPLF